MNTEEINNTDNNFVDEDALEHGQYVDGFSSRTVVGALFVALIMMPGAIYMGLVVGQSLGSAAEWVTIILFAELARRSFTQLKRQEVYVLFYVAAGIAAITVVHLMLAGGPFAITIWNQFLRQAPETSTIASEIPDWVVPHASSQALLNRNLAHIDWWWSKSSGLLSPVFMICCGYVLGRMAYFGMSYILFRLTSDRERLPFPMANVGAEGATALAESTERQTGAEAKKEPWRRRVFSVGACFGIAFGAVYILLPIVSGLFLAKPIMIFPIPFLDLTPNVEGVLPGSLVSISFDAAIFMIGMILPFRMVVGTFVAMVLTNLIGGPLLVKFGAVPHWQPGNRLLVNDMIMRFDFWMSVHIGVGLAVFIIGMWAMIKMFMKKKNNKEEAPDTGDAEREARAKADPKEPPYRRASKQRGDFPIWVCVFLFLFGIMGMCVLCNKLVPDFPLWIVVIFGFVWTPMISYVSARMFGFTGRGVEVPFLRETVFISSGYKKIDIWFAPIPMMDVGGGAQRFRELELTRTKFTSIVKAELLMLPIIFISSFLFWWFFWRIQQIPSSSFPFAARLWPIAARQAYLIFTANSTENPLLLQALHPTIIASSTGVGLVIYGAMALLGVPVQFFYGMLGGIGIPSHAGISIFLGALAGRYYFRRKFGEKTWSRYVPVVVAGFTCGMGLAGMTGVAFALIAKCVQDLPY